MKKYFVILAAGIIATSVSCTGQQQKEPGNSTENATADAAQKNLETSHLFNKAFETGDFSGIRAVIADDGVDHAGSNGDVRGVDSIVASLIAMQKVMTGIKSSVIKELADKDYVFQWLHSSGTMAIDGFGMKKGDKYEGDAIQVSKFNSDGKITEHWEFINTAEMMKMMGAAVASK